MMHPIDSAMINADINEVRDATKCYLIFVNYIEKPKGDVYGITVRSFSLGEKKHAIELCRSMIRRKKLPMFIEEMGKTYFRIYHKNIHKHQYCKPAAVLA